MLSCFGISIIKLDKSITVGGIPLAIFKSVSAGIKLNGIFQGEADCIAIGAAHNSRSPSYRFLNTVILGRSICKACAYQLDIFTHRVGNCESRYRVELHRLKNCSANCVLKPAGFVENASICILVSARRTCNFFLQISINHTV